MANNHSGSLAHGLRIVKALREVSGDFPFSFAVKLQYRDLDTFIHPDFQSRFDLKFVKRFMETRLSWEDFKRLKDAIQDSGFLSMCTPFDEVSVDRVEEHGYDIIKVASCSCTDWPLLERIVKCDKPVIASTAGVPLPEIDKVVSFFRHRNRDISLMHCVGEYPTKDDNLSLARIFALKQRYPDLDIGYSTHEDPNNCEAVQLAIGMGASIFEKHVGVAAESISLNAYSANPQQVKKWLESAARAYCMCQSRANDADAERESKDLRSLQRGVFVRRDLPAGAKLQPDDIFFAMPNVDGQLVANDISKYTDFFLTEALGANQPVMLSAVRSGEKRERLYKIISEVKKLLKRSKVVVPGQLELEVSHHYGLGNFPQFGSVMITVVNREYCKKVIVLLPGQAHPEQHHKRKDETYHVLHGEILLVLDGKESVHKKNDVVIIPRGVRHKFSTQTGTVIEEVSSTHEGADSFYSDPTIQANEDRKTFVTYWMD